MQPLLWAVLFGLIHTSVRADDDPLPNQYCVVGCQAAFSLSIFPSTSTDDAETDPEGCNNLVHTKSIYACARRYCSPSEIPTGVAYLNESCVQYYYSPTLDYSIISNLTDHDIELLLQISLEDAVGAAINITTIPDQDLFELGYRTVAVWYDQRDNHLLYSKAMFIFWGGVLLLGSMHNFASYIPARLPSARFRHLWSKVQGVLILSPTFAYYCDVPFLSTFTVPPRLESIIIALFFVVNLVLCSAKYEVFPDNIYYADTGSQLLRYIADRTGYLSYANLPIFWFFGVRNNILLWITGWHFPTFSRFHRWVAIIATLEAIVHSIAYTILIFWTGGYANFVESWSEQYWYMGGMATICMSLVLGFSVLWLRVRFYQFFLITHIVLALITLVALFYHTAIFLGQYDGFLWPCVALWSVDRLARFCRVAYNLYAARTMTAKVEYDAEAELVRVNLPDFMGQRIRMGAGSHFFVYMANQLRVWESHPFTLVQWKSGPEVGSETHASDEKETTESVARDVDRPYHYTFLVRPYKGFTYRLGKHALETTTSPKLLYEGPYGKRFRCGTDVSDVLFLVGGSGISVAISAIYELLERPSPPAIRLVWSTRHEGMLKSILQKELRHAHSRIRIDAHITRTELAELETNIGEKSNLRFDSSSLHKTSGRPNVEEYVAEASQSAERMLHVVACGPASMMNAVRLAVVEQLKNKREVRLSLESFAW